MYIHIYTFKYIITARINAYVHTHIHIHILYHNQNQYICSMYIYTYTYTYTHSYIYILSQPELIHMYIVSSLTPPPTTHMQEKEENLKQVCMYVCK